MIAFHSAIIELHSKSPLGRADSRSINDSIVESLYANGGD